LLIKEFKAVILKAKTKLGPTLDQINTVDKKCLNKIQELKDLLMVLKKLI